MRTALKALLTTLLMNPTLQPILAAQHSEMQSDRMHRDTVIHWPRAYDPTVAPVFSHNQLLIHATCHQAFARLADAPAWPTWLVIVKEVASQTPDTSGLGALYRLKIFNSPIQSRIVEFVPDQRISWIPFGADETEARHGHFHAWRFVPQASGCLVITEEPASDPETAKILSRAVTSCTKRTSSGWIVLDTSVNLEPLKDRTPPLDHMARICRTK